MKRGLRFSLNASLPSWKSSLRLVCIMSALSAISASCSVWNGSSQSWRLIIRSDSGEHDSASSFA